MPSMAGETLCNKSNIVHIRNSLISPLTAEKLTVVVVSSLEGLYHSEEGSSNAEDPEDV